MTVGQITKRTTDVFLATQAVQGHQSLPGVFVKEHWLGCGTRCTAAMPFMIRPCLKPLPGQTSVLWVMMVLKLLCSLLRNFFSTKSATPDLFLLWGRSLGCRYYFFTNSLEALKVSFQLLNKWFLEEMVWCLYWKSTGWGNTEILWRSFFLFQSKRREAWPLPINVVSSAGFNAC